MKTLLALAALALGVVPALGDSVKVGDLTLENAWARATPKGSQVGAGYLTIENGGATPDRLIGVTADFATVQVHEMKMNEGVMQMREVVGLTIPAHGVVKLAPSGFHLMFIGLKHPLVKGDTAKATFTFEHAGPASIDLPILGVGAAGPAAPANAMKGMKM